MIIPSSSGFGAGGEGGVGTGGSTGPYNFSISLLSLGFPVCCKMILFKLIIQTIWWSITFEPLNVSITILSISQAFVLMKNTRKMKLMIKKWKLFQG